jgi:3-hydroxyisobutyrate dehydrogenase
MAKGSGGSRTLERCNPWPGVMDDVPAARAYRNGFGSALMLKDQRLAQETALATRSATPLGAPNFSSIAEAIRRRP